MPNDRLAFEPFGSLENVLSGGPVKIMPLGVFYRDSRKLEITEADLREIEKNVAAGLPRFRIPINENHNGVGKVGTVGAVKFMSDGPDGAGLYATEYELTEAGKKLIADKRFDAVSPEIMWKKNGATYQDPQTGKQHDNVIVGLALTDRPFFGHDNVALFSADMPSMAPPPKRNNGYTKLKELMRQKFDELMAMVTDKDGDGEPDPMPEMMPMTATLIETTSVATPNSDPTAPAPAPADIVQGKDNMTQPTQPSVTPPAPEKFNISAEEFAAIKAKADRVEALELASAKQAESFAAQLKATEARALAIERAAKLAQMQAHCESFSAIPVKADELAEKFMALQESNADLFTYFDGLVTALDNQIATAGLFSQVTSARAQSGPETYEAFAVKIHKERFNSDPAKLSEAYNVAAKERPDLYRAYDESYTVRRKGE